MPRRFYDIAVAVGIGALVWHRRSSDGAASQTPAVAERTLHAPLVDIELIDSQVAEVTAEIRGRLIYSISPALLFLASLALLLYPQYTNTFEFRQLVGGSIGLSAQEIVAVNLALLALVATLTVALVVGGSASRASARNIVWASNCLNVATAVAVTSIFLAGLALLGATKRHEFLQGILALAVAALTAILIASCSEWDGKSVIQLAERKRSYIRCRTVLGRYENRPESNHFIGPIVGFVCVVGAIPAVTLVGLQLPTAPSALRFGTATTFALATLVGWAVAAIHLAALLYVLNLEFHNHLFDRSATVFIFSLGEVTLVFSAIAVAIQPASAAQTIGLLSCTLGWVILPIGFITTGWWKGWGWSASITVRQLRRGREREAELARDIARLNTAVREQTWVG